MPVIVITSPEEPEEPLPVRDSVSDAKSLLVRTDWTQLADTPESVRSSFALYRSELRAIIAAGNPDVDLPVAPSPPELRFG